MPFDYLVFIYGYLSLTLYLWLINLVFLVYYVWGFFSYLVFFFKGFIECLYIKYNKNTLNRKRDFDDLSYFEKLFLTMFHRNNIFKKSLANLYSNDNLFNHRKDKYPLIFFFHLYYDKANYKLSDLKDLNTYFLFFSKSNVFKKVFLKLNSIFFKLKHSKLTNYIIFLVIQKLLYKRYYNLCNSVYFKNCNKYNLIKFNWLFYVYILNSKSTLIIYDLSKYSDWYDFNFKHTKVYEYKQVFTRYEKKINIIKKKSFLNFKVERYLRIHTTYKIYNLFFKKLLGVLKNKYKNIFVLNFRVFSIKKIIINSNWLKALKVFYPTRFSESSISKFIDLKNSKNYLFFYIRKNRIFNKGRYSRNRQLYRTGVYWCLWLNIILVYGLYFMFYRFTFNFGYFWWGLLILFYSSIFSRMVKYNYYNIYNIVHEFFSFAKWVGFILIGAKTSVHNFLKFVFYTIFYKNNVKNKTSYMYSFYYLNCLSCIKNLINFLQYKNNDKFVYFWESLKYKDRSFLKYKSILHWFGQVYKILTF